MDAHADLLVFSHLRWDFVWQRPQHLLTRLAKNRRVFFIEEPVHDPNVQAPQWNLEKPAAGVTVCRCHTSISTPGFCDAQLSAMRAPLWKLIKKENLENAIAWFYTPMALPLLEVCPHSAVAYDCMDELSAFRNAPAQMLQREYELLKKADIVFTGGPSLYRAKKDRHPNVHCFPSSVATDHFGKAKAGLPESADQAAIPHPRFGFFGVIDERFDVPLLAALAEARPDWQFVMVGPIVKIDPASLPHADNIHYLGKRSYEDLPALLAGWDVCLLPFAQ